MPTAFTDDHPPALPPIADLEGVDELSTRVFRAFLTAMRLHMQLLVKNLAVLGMHPGQAFCLRLLDGRDGITQRDIADELHVSRPTVTRMLQGMEKAGLVERRADDRDQRLTRVYLTASGRDLQDEIHLVASGYVRETIGALPETDRVELERLLGDLAERIESALARPAGRVDDPDDDGPLP